MPFNYGTQAPVFQIANQQLIDNASKTPFSIAGHAMNQLNDDIQNRVFADKASKANSLSELRGLYNPQTKESQAILANQGNLLSQIGAEQNRADLLNLRKQQFDMNKTLADQTLSDAKVASGIRQNALGKLGVDTLSGLPKLMDNNSQYTKLKLPLIDQIQAERNAYGNSPTFDLLQEKDKLSALKLNKTANPKYGTYIVNGKPTRLTDTEAYQTNAIPLSDYNKYKDSITDTTDVIGTDGKPLPKQIAQQIDEAVQPYLLRDTRDKLLQDSLDKVNAGIFTFDGEPNKKQFESLSTSLGEMVNDPKWKFNTVNAGSGLELINLINSYRKKHNQSQILRESPTQRLISKLPFTDDGYKTTSSKAEDVQLFKDYLENTTKPSNSIPNTFNF